MYRVFFFLLLSCSYSICGANEYKKHVNTDSIRLEIHFAEKSSACRIATFFTKASFSFDLISSNGEAKKVALNISDTVLNIPSEYVFLSIPTEGFIYGRSCYYSLPEKGKITITIKNGVPAVANLNNAEKSIYEFWNIFYNRCPYFKINQILFESDVNTDINKKNLYYTRKHVYHQALELLDSLKNADAFTQKRDYYFIKEILKYEWLADCLLTSQQVKSFYKRDSDFIKNTSELDKFKNDELINFSTYQFFLQNYLERILLKDDRVRINAHGFTYKYYDAISYIDSMPPSLSKNYLLKYCLEKTNENFDSRTTLEAISNVRKSLPEPFVSDFLGKIKQQVQLRTTIESNNAGFVTADLKINTLKDIMEANKGKVLYIDIWASWCIPCRVALPYSVALQKKFQNRQIAFIYFSIDEDFDKWKIASIQENLNLYPLSYKVTNPKKSSFLRELGISEIPRYLIFNKQGRLIHSNAPGPDSNEIEVLLEKYLSAK